MILKILLTADRGSLSLHVFGELEQARIMAVKKRLLFFHSDCVDLAFLRSFEFCKATTFQKLSLQGNGLRRVIHFEGLLATFAFLDVAYIIALQTGPF